MNVVTHDQQQIQKAISEGKAETRDLTVIIEEVIRGLLPAQLLQNLTIQAEPDLIEAYLVVEKDFAPIPWIDPQYVVVLDDVPSRIVFDKKVQRSETQRLKKLGFPADEIPDLIQAHIRGDKQKREELEATGKTYVRPANFVFAWTKPEGQHGVLVTTIDRTNIAIYSVATSVDTSLSLLKQCHYFKTVMMYLLRDVPLSMQTRELRYAYHTIQGNRLHFFISIK